jgi:NAD(P)-dependent dehydrogenase (short-subunit alcohol dehydrogenase family)
MSGSSKKVWFITGASSGLGLEIARSALQRGDLVVATARDPATITTALGVHEGLFATTLNVNVNDEAQAIAAAQAAVDRFDRIDVLVNNAGYGLLTDVEEANAEEVERLFQTNFFGLLNVTFAVLPHLRGAGKATSSISRRSSAVPRLSCCCAPENRHGH